jgi:hypothetical protein
MSSGDAAEEAGFYGRVVHATGELTPSWLNAAPSPRQAYDRAPD